MSGLPSPTPPKTPFEGSSSRKRAKAKATSEASSTPSGPEDKKRPRRADYEEKESASLDSRSMPPPDSRSDTSGYESEPDDGPGTSPDVPTFEIGGARFRPKRTRTLMTPHQLNVLHSLLATTRFPTTAQREEAAAQIGLSARKVQVWFQNQRQKQNLEARKTFLQNAVAANWPPAHDPSQPSASATTSVVPSQPSTSRSHLGRPPQRRPDDPHAYNEDSPPHYSPEWEYSSHRPPPLGEHYRTTPPSVFGPPLSGHHSAGGSSRGSGSGSRPHSTGYSPYQPGPIPASGPSSYHTVLAGGPSAPHYTTQPPFDHPAARAASPESYHLPPLQIPDTHAPSHLPLLGAFQGGVGYSSRGSPRALEPHAHHRSYSTSPDIRRHPAQARPQSSLGENLSHHARTSSSSALLHEPRASTPDRFPRGLFLPPPLTLQPAPVWAPSGGSSSTVVPPASTQQGPTLPPLYFGPQSPPRRPTMTRTESGSSTRYDPVRSPHLAHLTPRSPLTPTRMQAVSPERGRDSPQSPSRSRLSKREEPK